MATRSRRNTPTNTQKLDAGALNQMRETLSTAGITNLGVEVGSGPLVLLSADTVQGLRERGVITEAQMADYEALRAVEGERADWILVESVVPLPKAGTGRPLIPNPRAEYEAAIAQLGPDASDEQIARKRNISVRTIVSWRHDGHIPPKKKRAPRILRLDS